MVIQQWASFLMVTWITPKYWGAVEVQLVEVLCTVILETIRRTFWILRSMHISCLFSSIFWNKPNCLVIKWYLSYIAWIALFLSHVTCISCWGYVLKFITVSSKASCWTQSWVSFTNLPHFLTLTVYDVSYCLIKSWSLMQLLSSKFLYQYYVIIPCLPSKICYQYIVNNCISLLSNARWLVCINR
jgi:hypothetical protein